MSFEATGPQDKEREVPPVADDPIFLEQLEEWEGARRGNESIEEIVPGSSPASGRTNESVETGADPDDREG